MSLSEARVDEAAKTLAIEARSLVGLPLDPGCSKWVHRIGSPPCPLEFSRMISRHIPLLIGKCIDERPCSQLWKQSSYLVEHMGDRKVEVTLTPDGRADDIHTTEEGKDVFVLPHTVHLTMGELLSQLKSNSPVAYLQSQNSNLTDNEMQLSPLLQDLCDAEGRSSLEWADEALGQKPTATNLWIGTAKSKTSMHRDHYENIFTVLRGVKIFTLYPPSEAYFLCDDEPYDVYHWTLHDGAWQMLPAQSPPTPWIPIDPTEAASSERNRRYPRFAKALKPLVVEVSQGETLYLPAGWFPHVGQRGDAEGLCVCVNWWYESDFAFTDRWALEAFVKEIGQAARG